MSPCSGPPTGGSSRGERSDSATGHSANSAATFRPRAVVGRAAGLSVDPAAGVSVFGAEAGASAVGAEAGASVVEPVATDGSVGSEARPGTAAVSTVMPLLAGGGVCAG